MIPVSLLLGILFAHWLGDFLCQIAWMANNKYNNRLALIAHVTTYTIVIAAALFLLTGCQLHILLMFALTNFLAHLVTDAVSSRITHNLYKQEKYRMFFNIIGLDQYCHMVVLVLTLLLV